MKNLIFLFLGLILLISCSVKKRQELKQTTQKQSFEVKNDSISQEETQQKTASFLSVENTSFEMEITSEKDSLGNPKEMILERIRSPTSEKIRVVGGKVHIKQATTQKQLSEQITELQQNKQTFQTQKTQQKQTQTTEFEQTKQTQPTFSFWGVFTILLILLLMKWGLKRV